MKKIISASDASKLIKSNMTIMIGGFVNIGSPTIVIEELLKTDINNLTLIANDTSKENLDKGKLITAGKVSKVITSHIGLNTETIKQMHNKTLSVELSPQGTLIERIRAGGNGLGGILTPVGIGTSIEDGKTIINNDGKDWILETPLHADISLIYGTTVDKFGNVKFKGTTRNTNVIMATAADIVIIEAEEITDNCLDPNEIIIPGIFIDYIVKKQ